MSRWFVALEGHAMDLEEFPLWFPSGDVYAVLEDAKVLLTGSRWTNLDRPEQVRDAAMQVLDEFSAAISLCWPAFIAPKIGVIYEERANGTRKGTQFGSVGMAISRTKARAVAVVAQTSSPQQTQTAAQLLLAASRLSSHLSVALLLWADPVRTWPRLYRLVEELEQHERSSLNKAGHCSSAELVRFNRSSNSDAVAGKDSRHAGGKFAPPPDPMSLDDAITFTRKVLTSVLNSHTGERSNGAV